MIEAHRRQMSEQYRKRLGGGQMTPALSGLVLQIIVYVLVFGGLLVWVVRNKWFSWQPFGSGILVFVVFVLILEQIVHSLMIAPPAGEGSFPHLRWSDSPLLYALYGAFMAGVFEEGGRIIAFFLLIPRRHKYGDGFVYGLGHGGAELLLIGLVSAINALVLIMTVSSEGAQPILQNIPADQLKIIEQSARTIQETPFFMFIIGLLERFAALFIQIALSLFVLLGIRQKRYLVFPAAILLHALVDFMPALYQAGIIRNIWIVEGVVWIFGILALGFVFGSRRLFQAAP
ncbi:MAG: hypothetical protein BSOLF_2010 [Candidatus Carbobacillus altaicus]|uniref:YhfC family intramembrane metalloprotease n=1 Tax=Candidatus Carbonibacillus altaicus TaxID=2163959 RepID=A0A2R6Y3N8_9BACL|nr:MAG: hypothetical protein BSOLF_2010 [Candidatus Carbobacillus altaicus]